MVVNNFLNEDLLKYENPTFESFFAPTYYGSICAGFLKERGPLYACYRKYILYSLMTFLLLLCATIYEDIYGDRDSEDTVRQFAMFLMLLICLVKWLSGTIWSTEYAIIKNTITEDFSKLNSMTITERTIVSSYAKSSKFMQYLWGTIVAAILSSFAIMSLGTMVVTWSLDGVVTKAMLSELYIPFIEQVKYNSPYFEIFWLIFAIEGFTLVAMFVGYDCLLFIALVHACGKIEVIKSKLRGLRPDDAVYDSQSTRLKLRLIIEQHQKIYYFCEHLQKLSSAHNFTIFLLNSMEISTTGYQVIKGIERGFVPPEFFLFFLASFLHIFMPCYFCALLAKKSLEVSDAAYESGWERALDRGLRVELVVLMMRAQRPIVMTTKVGPVNMEMFSTVVRAAWSYSTLMRNR